MARYIKDSEDRSRLPRGGVGSYRALLPRGDRYPWATSAVPPYTMVLLAEEALGANRVEQAECLIEAVYALYD